MGHMWELGYQQWIGPAMVAAASLSGMAVDKSVVWGGFAAGFITVIAAPSVLGIGFLADKIGRTKSILLCSLCSLIPQFILGFLIGSKTSLTLVMVVALWIGFWVVADTSIFKAGLTEMTEPKIRGTFLGLEGAIGALMMVISPLGFGYVLEIFNGPGDPTAATNWWPAFALFGVGALMAPLGAVLLRFSPQAKLMAGGRM
jgi:MFS family permease